MIDTGIKQNNSFFKTLLEIVLIVVILALTYLWFYSHNNIIAKATGLFGLIISGLTFFKPGLFNSFRSYLVYPEKVADQYYLNLQKVNSILGVVIYAFIFINYRITSTRELGFLGVVLSLYIIILSILWWNNMARYTQPSAQFFVTFSLLLCILIIPFSLKWILTPKPWTTHFEPSWPGFIGSAIGFLMALLMIKFGKKKLW